MDKRTKRCSICGNEKSFDCFGKHIRMRYGLRSACKECERKLPYTKRSDEQKARERKSESIERLNLTDNHVKKRIWRESKYKGIVCCTDECSYNKFLAYKRRIYEPKPKTERTCKICEKLFESSRPSERCCSDECKKINADNGKNHKHRALHFNVEYEYINSLKVFMRDGWHCQICGKVTPKERRGTNYTNAPELDHRIPMSKGGGHLYSNVQCACRKCNGEKSNKDNRGQMPLFEIAAIAI